jgi:hypothetical protein
MDPQGSRDGRVAGWDRRQWRGGPTVGSRLRLGALVFVLGLAGFFALAYFGVVGDRRRGDPAGSLVDAAGLAALVTALNVVLGPPLLWRLRHWVQGDEQQRR